MSSSPAASKRSRARDADAVSGGGVAEEAPVAAEQLEMARAYVRHRFRSGVNPVNVAAPGTDDPAVRALTEQVLEREYNMVCLQIEHATEDVADLQEQQDSLGLGTERCLQLISMYDMKLLESREHLDRMDAAMARAGVAIPTDFNGLATMCVVAETDAGRVDEAAHLLDLARGTAAGRRQLGSGTGDQEKGVDDDDSNNNEGGSGSGGLRLAAARAEAKLAVATESGRLQRALVDAMRACVTTQFARLLECASAQCTLRRRTQFSRQWCEEAMGELQRLQQRRQMLAAEKAERERRIEEARRALDEAHRSVFARRKQFIITHKRLMGRERLRNGGMLRPGVAQDVINVIRQELHEGRTATLAALADSDCADLEKFTESGPDGGGGGGIGLLTPRSAARTYTPRGAAAAWADTAGGGGGE